MEFTSHWSISDGPRNMTDIVGDKKARKIWDSIGLISENQDPWSSLVVLISQSEDEPDAATLADLLRHVSDINVRHPTGVTLLIYAIVFDNPLFIELLHSTGRLDANLPDTIVGYTPLMWCFHLERQKCCIELLNFWGEIDLDATTETGSTALDLLVPGSTMYEFAEEHELLTSARRSSIPDLYKAPPTFTTDVDHTIDNIALQAAGLTLEESEPFEAEKRLNPVSDPFNDYSRTDSIAFDFDNLHPDQFIEFADYDIPRILELLMQLPLKKPHKTCTPAAVIFQCIRYADRRRQSKALVESFTGLSLTKILSTIVSSSGGVVSENPGDIVSQSYWLSALCFLFYYLYREESFFKRYPKILQDLIDGIRATLVELVSSINSRVAPLIDSTILKYTSIEQVKQTLYRSDWNLFKKRRGKAKDANSTSYDKILTLLYPPSVEEQKKPSPLKVVQIFGAMLYVLDLHHLHPLIAQQCLSLSMKWFSSCVFNKIISDKRKLLSRAHAIQIRLNLSAIEDWIKNHDFTAPVPNMIDEFMWQRFPFTLIFDLKDIDVKNLPPEPRNITSYRPKKTNVIEDASNSLFYYQSFYCISQIHMKPLLQLLQWLQVATSMRDEESLMATSSMLDRINFLQLLKSIGRYKYELEEPKFKSSLKKKLEAIINESPSQELYLPEKTLPALTLPTIAELIDFYANREDGLEFLPFLTPDIQDDLNEIHDQNLKSITTAATDDNYNDNDSEDDDKGNEKVSDTAENELFSTLNAPSAAAQKPLWAINSDIEGNPW